MVRFKVLVSVLQNPQRTGLTWTAASLLCKLKKNCLWSRQALDIPQGDECGGQQNCQSSDMASSHKSKGPVMAVIIQEVISDCVVEHQEKRHVTLGHV